jgi:hypothetical protein
MAPDFGAGFEVLVFLVLTVVQALLSLLVLSYTGHSFLDIFIDTAAGSDEVHWSRDPFQDWIFRFFYLVWLVAVWAAPAALVLKFLDLPRLIHFLCLFGVLWLVFPVTLLSSLSASSSLVLLRGVIVGLLLKHPAALFRFYASSGLVLAVCGGLAYAGVLSEYSILLIPAAAAGAIGIFVYGRLLGRLAWLTSLRTGSKKKPADPPRPEEAERIVTFDPWHVPEKKKPAAPEPAKPSPPRQKSLPKKHTPRKPAARAYDPWAKPPEETARPAAKPSAIPVADPEDPLGPAQGTYELMAMDAPVPPTQQERIDPDVEGYGVSAPDEIAQAPAPVTPEIAKEEEQLAAPRKPPRLPPRPFLDGVYSFPFYPTSAGAVGIVALGLLAVGSLLRLQIAFFPSAWK